MGKIPTLEEARALLAQYNSEPFHLKHGEIVSGVLGVFAKEFDPDRVEFWQVAGMLHDLDFEQWPEEHCVKAQKMMTEMGLDEDLIHAVVSHGWGITVDVEPVHQMEKILFAADELTGLIGACALMRPSKSVMDMEPKSVKKKYKNLNFAAGCSREVIGKGAELLGWELDELIARTLAAMQEIGDI
ncbi:MAG: hydrolase [Oscillospiraceae bacterium]|nr:hydrolase [Oscillospiraceae bacterium]